MKPNLLIPSVFGVVIIAHGIKTPELFSYVFIGVGCLMIYAPYSMRIKTKVQEQDQKIQELSKLVDSLKNQQEKQK